MGEKFFRGINEEKQSYVKVGGRLLKKKNKQLLKKKNLGLPFQRTFVFPSVSTAINFSLTFSGKIRSIRYVDFFKKICLICWASWNLGLVIWLFLNEPCGFMAES